MAMGWWMQVKAIWAFTVLLMHLFYRPEISHIKSQRKKAADTPRSPHRYLVCSGNPVPPSPQQQMGDLWMKKSNRWSLGKVRVLYLEMGGQTPSPSSFTKLPEPQPPGRFEHFAMEKSSQPKIEVPKGRRPPMKQSSQSTVQMGPRTQNFQSLCHTQ